MDVYWLEQSASDVPSRDTWLSQNEINQLGAMRFARRRRDWLLGRWTAKNAVAIYLGVGKETHSLSEIEIRPALSGAPEVFIRNQPSAVRVSLSHRADIGACAIAPPNVLLGCDLEKIEPHEDAFVADYFTAEEHALVARAVATERLRVLTLLWSGKESTLKALREGLRLDTRSVVVSFLHSPTPQYENIGSSTERASLSKYLPLRKNWSPMQACTVNGQTFRGWWSQTGDLLRTVVAEPPPNPPILLAQDGSRVF
jgi:4'-phosphopantetheinyl transferase